ncbi:undecaprenyl-diphosphate phosphatase [Sulfurivermis fontis]|uniref:undecaprenyl-diphosphate phosphatase n=1 Tax=Sulfurivermis fontis TaxID=1972068 RepID=UPI000FD8FA68|nr:undecaprenyl-diphosphate phosphatase [Sulfurivermis fontis]
MELIQIIALAILQGLTEFLPISSSAHLILLPQMEGWADQGLAFDVAVHVGTLAAVVWYFRRDLLLMTRDWGRSVATRQMVGESRLAWAVLFGTIPVGLAGLLFKGLIETELRSPLVIAWATVVFAPLLWWADVRGRGARSEHAIGWKDVLVIGVAQALALIPGTSRSGITMTAGLMLGLSRSAAARFSFLLSIPVIVLAGGLNTIDLVRGEALVDWTSLLLGSVLSGLAAYLCIHVFLRLLERIGMLPFVIYRLLLGAGLLYLYS